MVALPSEKQKRPALLRLTEKAKERAKCLIEARPQKPLGLRLSLKTQGCTGMAYALSYVDQLIQGDEYVQEEHLDLYIDPKAVPFLIGTVMDFDDDPVNPGFVFKNPQEKGRCGCGKSFHV